MQSPAADVRTTAASTLTKLALKAKALETNSSETTQAMNVALSVLKNALSTQIPLEDKHRSLTDVSFSNLDGSHALGSKANLLPDGTTISKQKNVSSIERAIEVLAALVGKSAVKEELVHGSSRCVNNKCEYDLIRL